MYYILIQQNVLGFLIGAEQIHKNFGKILLPALTVSENVGALFFRKEWANKAMYACRIFFPRKTNI